MNNKKQVYNDIVIVRLGLIILLVFFHAFAIYGGAWNRRITPPPILNSIIGWTGSHIALC